LLSSSPKVPYDNRGIAQVVAQLITVLELAFRQGIIAANADGVPMYSVTAPSREEIPVNDRAARVLPDISFEFILAGAIHKVAPIRGIIKV